MTEIGKTTTLPVARIVDFGAWLDAAEMGEILLPKRRCPDDINIGDRLEVFVYLESNDLPIATTLRPKAEVGQFAYLKVVDVSAVGAFLDWGLDKDVLAPFGEQRRKMEVGQSYLVYLTRNAADGRIVASSKIDRFLDDNEAHDFRRGQKVDLIIANRTELGYKAIINHRCWGLLYTNEVFQHLGIGQSITGYIKRIRDDGKIDLTLQHGQETRDKNAQTVLQYLKKQGGFTALHDKSDPQQIKRLLGMSKASFKKTIGGLYKQRIIRIEKEGIRLLHGE